MEYIDPRPCKGDLYAPTCDEDVLPFLVCEDCQHWRDKCLGAEGWEWIARALLDIE